MRKLPCFRVALMYIMQKMQLSFLKEIYVALTKNLYHLYEKCVIMLKGWAAKRQRAFGKGMLL